MTDTPTRDSYSQPSPIGQRVDGESDAPAVFDASQLTPPVGPNTITTDNSANEPTKQPGPLNTLLAHLASFKKKGKHPAPASGAFGKSRTAGSWSDRRETRREREKRLAREAAAKAKS